MHETNLGLFFGTFDDFSYMAVADKSLNQTSASLEHVQWLRKNGVPTSTNIAKVRKAMSEGALETFEISETGAISAIENHKALSFMTKLIVQAIDRCIQKENSSEVKKTEVKNSLLTRIRESWQNPQGHFL